MCVEYFIRAALCSDMISTHLESPVQMDSQARAQVDSLLRCNHKFFVPLLKGYTYGLIGMLSSSLVSVVCFVFALQTHASLLRCFVVCLMQGLAKESRMWLCSEKETVASQSLPCAALL